MSPTLKERDESMDVYALQTDLGALGYCTSMDGTYGRMTTNAVSHFQEKHKLPMTGEADSRTARRIKLEIQERGRRLQSAALAAGQVA